MMIIRELRREQEDPVGQEESPTPTSEPRPSCPPIGDKASDTGMVMFLLEKDVELVELSLSYRDAMEGLQAVFESGGATGSPGAIVTSGIKTDALVTATERAEDALRKLQFWQAREEEEVVGDDASSVHRYQLLEGAIKQAKLLRRLRVAIFAGAWGEEALALGQTTLRSTSKDDPLFNRALARVQQGTVSARLKGVHQELGQTRDRRKARKWSLLRERTVSPRVRTKTATVKRGTWAVNPAVTSAFTSQSRTNQPKETVVSVLGDADELAFDSERVSAEFRLAKYELLQRVLHAKLVHGLNEGMVELDVEAGRPRLERIDVTRLNQAVVRVLKCWLSPLDGHFSDMSNV